MESIVLDTGSILYSDFTTTLYDAFMIGMGVGKMCKIYLLSVLSNQKDAFHLYICIARYICSTLQLALDVIKHYFDD